jgi:hypothetical protein
LLQQPLVGQLSLVLGDERRRQAAAQGVLHHFVILACSQQYADRRVLVRLLHVPVQRLQVERKLAQVLWLEASDLQLDGHQAVQPTMEEQHVQGEVPPAHLQ